MTNHVPEYVFVFVQFFVVLKNSGTYSSEHPGINHMNKGYGKRQGKSRIAFNYITVIKDKRMITL